MDSRVTAAGVLLKALVGGLLVALAWMAPGNIKCGPGASCAFSEGGR